MLQQTTTPKNVEAEQQLLASFLADDGTAAFDEAAATLQESDFYDYKNQIIFRCIKSIVQSGDCIDEISISEELKKNNLMDSIGGIQSMFDSIGKHPTGQRGYCIDTIKEKSNLRQLIRKFQISVESMQDESKNSKEISSEVEDLILNLADGSNRNKGIDSSMREIQKEFDMMLSGEYKPKVIRSYIDHLDEKLSEGGVGLGEVLVIAAPTSCGKSQLALNIGSRNMQREQKPCMIFSLEMPQKQILKRMIHTISGVPSFIVRNGTATEDQMQDVKLTMQDVQALPMYTSHKVRNVEDLVVQCRTMHRKFGIELVIIDYLQLIPWDARKFDKVQAISDISHKIKQMAIELNLPVILLSQINREGAKSEALQLYHLRDSGDIENDADVIILMYPDGMTMDRATRVDINGEYKKMIYNIAKNREGERDVKGEFKFYNKLGRFY